MTKLSLWFVVVNLLCLAALTLANMPLPFYRELKFTNPLLSGDDVTIVQTLLNRDPSVANSLIVDGVFGENSQIATIKFQTANSIKSSGIIDKASADMLLKLYEADGYKDSGFTAASKGYLYKFHIPVHTNRSIETYATLFDKDNKVLLKFRARTHGMRSDGTAGAWPDYGTSPGDIGLNQFSSDGNTPTGLVEMDLNTPEPDPKVYGPWNVNRVVRGLEGNALLSKIFACIFMVLCEF